MNYARYMFWLLAAALIVCALVGCPRDKGGGEPAADDAAASSAPAEPAVHEPAAAENPGIETEPAVTDPAAATPENTGATTEEAAGVTRVVLETSKGKVVLAVHADWAPTGAAHFLKLVAAKYYDGAPWFRVFKDPMGISVAQCGIAADPKVTAQWQEQTIMDEEVVKGNLPGTVAFGKSMMPNSRSTHIFVNLSDNSAALDPQKFACFAEVVEGLDVVNKLKETGSGTVDQGQLSMRGIDYFREIMPDGDVIEKAYVEE